MLSRKILGSCLLSWIVIINVFVLDWAGSFPAAAASASEAPAVIAAAAAFSAATCAAAPKPAPRAAARTAAAEPHHASKELMCLEVMPPALP